MAANEVPYLKRKEDHTQAFFTFGRFQPPTIGHKVLIDQVADLARMKGGDAYVFVSSKQNEMAKYLKSKRYLEMQKGYYFESTDANENPLSVGDKVGYLKKMHPYTEVEFVNTTECNCRTIIMIVRALYAAGYKDLTMVVGTDRVDDFTKILPGVTIVPVKQKRTLNTNAGNFSTSGMSGTKMRKAAVAENFESFKAGVMMGDMTEGDAVALMDSVRLGLGYAPLGTARGGVRMRGKTRRRNGGRKIRRAKKTRRA